MSPQVQTFFDEATFTFTHLVSDPATKRAAIIDPVLDYDAAAVRTSNDSAEKLLAEIESQGLSVDWILETHVHADHMTAAAWLAGKLKAKIAVGEKIEQVQNTFNDIYGYQGEDRADAAQFDLLLADQQTIALGELEIKTIATPGHTPSCCTYLIGNCAFVGDTIFMPDFGTARCDFPNGDARQLYQSIQKILALPPETQLFMCHDYMPGGRELKWQSSVAEQKAHNIHVNDNISEDDFVKMRTERDAKLSVPKLILPALQVNIKAGRLPPADKQGERYLKLPLNKF